MTARHLIITGGTGYIGAWLVKRALAEGRQVTLLGRRPGPAGTRHVPWSLGDAFPAAALDGPAGAALIHLAHDWHGDTNVAATGRLFDTAQSAGVVSRVFISSQSAREHALNRYGRMKWQAERRVTDATSLRVGLVYGGPRVAMYGLLCRLAQLPMLPMIEPHRLVQPIHVDEVACGILAAADGRARGVLALAGPDRIRFDDVLRLLAQRYGGRRLPILPIPLRAALAVCDLSARLPLLPTVDRERVLGLAGTEPIDSTADLARLGVAIRPIAQRLAEEPAGRRALLAEARAFLADAGIAATPALLQRYARAFPQGALTRPHILPGWRTPFAGPIADRLRVAARIAEASAPGEAMLARGTRWSRLVVLALGGVVEMVRLPTRIVATLAAR
ncbi:NADH dehydrogenase [Sphingomonas sp. BE138]|uniref:NAD-dependent epimerase/dehydratase family protein n=1 Tax=Sphingomonas sp. BE138 TaxID=2817845 RepID=UPI002864B20B|nr:NAD-dependent epimerase/dehydratase family protein [Sphingomonas sp. BE138]MDR6789741.1 NADH dehydrogenase [Sphingomonas sp. BE138]